MRASDAPALAERRSDPISAEFQAWAVPFTLAQAEALIQSALLDEEPVSDAWFMATIEERATSSVVGDIAIRLEWAGRSAEVGYTLGPTFRGNGFATEALEATLAYLFDVVGVTRVHASLHPENVASARVLERTGFVYEGTSRSAFWVGDVVSDDPHYGMIRADWESWLNRIQSSPDAVRLVEIDGENWRSYGALATHRSQERMVAPVLKSFAAAAFPPTVEGEALEPWLRGVEADGGRGGDGYVVAIFSTTS